MSDQDVRRLSDLAANYQLQRTQACRSRLLTLPAELRTLIWNFVLQEDTTVNIDANLKLPDLLAACHQTRHEAYHIYFNTNRWSHRVQDMNTAILRAWMQNIWMSTDRQRKIKLSIRGAKHWQNLVAWLDLIFESGPQGTLFMSMRAAPKGRAPGTLYNAPPARSWPRGAWAVVGCVSSSAATYSGSAGVD